MLIVYAQCVVLFHIYLSILYWRCIYTMEISSTPAYVEFDEVFVSQDHRRVKKRINTGAQLERARRRVFIFIG